MHIAREDLSKKEAEAASLRAALSQIRSQADASIAEVRNLEQKLGLQNTKLAEASSSLSEMDQQLKDAEVQGEAMERTLAGRSHDDAEYERLKTDLAGKTAEISSLISSATESQAEKKHLEVLEFGARQELSIAQEAIMHLKEEMTSLAGRLADNETRMQTSLEDHTAAMR